MRAFLRRLPIRWQITVLHATILMLVLVGCGLLLYTQQRAFLFDSAATRLRAQARPLIDAILKPQPNPAPPPRQPDTQLPLQPTLDQPLRQILVQLADALASRDTAAQVLQFDGTLVARGTHTVRPHPRPHLIVICLRVLRMGRWKSALLRRFVASAFLRS